MDDTLNVILMFGSRLKSEYFRYPHSDHIHSRLCFLQEKAAKWKTSDGQMDGLTTNGVLVMHPRNGFTQDSKPGVWREISVCGNVFTLRETRSAQQRGKMVREENMAKSSKTETQLLKSLVFHSM